MCAGVDLGQDAYIGVRVRVRARVRVIEGEG